MSEIFKTADQIAKDYGIPRSVVYHRIKKHRYRVNDQGLVLVMDVERIERTGIKKGRPNKYNK